MTAHDTDQIVSTVGTTQVQYSVLELKARLGEYAMLAHTLNAALVRAAARAEPQAPAGDEQAAPADPSDDAGPRA